MEEIYKKILALVKNGDILVSNHGYDELAKDDIFVKDIIASVGESVLIEIYPNYSKRPCNYYYNTSNK